MEIHSLQMMDDYYADMGGNEDHYDDGGEGHLNIDERLYEFQRTINRLREVYRQRRQEERHKKSPSKAKEDVTMKEE
jgi:hypothetical protein